MKKTLTLLMLMLICILQSRAQWVQTGPEAVGIIKIIENNGILYSTNLIGLYKSTDNGLNWNRVSTFAGFTMNDLVFTNSKMVASTNKGIFCSADGGITWVTSNQGLSGGDSTTSAFYITKLLNNRLITRFNSGIYYSDNEGQHWDPISNAPIIFKAIVVGSYILATDGLEFYTTVDNGLTWQNLNSTGLPASPAFTELLHINNSYYINGNNTDFYKSTDNGLSWTSVNSGITGSSQGKFYSYNSRIFKKMTTGVFEYDFSSSQWNINSNLTPNFILSGFSSGRYFGINGYSYDGLVFSDDNGATWQDCNGVNCMIVQKLSVSDNLYALWSVGGYIYDSTQTSYTRFSPYNQNYSSNTYAQYGVLDIKKRSNGTIYLATAGGVWKSINNGVSYTQSYTGIPASGAIPTRNVYDMFISGSFPNDTLYIANDNGIYYSTDDAQTFTQCTSTNGAKMQQFLKYDGVLYCAGTKIYKLGSSNNWSQFTAFTNTGILGFAATDGYLFVSTGNNTLKYAPVSGLASFTPITSGSPGFAYSVAAYDTLVFYYNEAGVWKLNTTLLGSATPSDLVQVAPDLPFYRIPSQAKRYSYLSNGFSMAVFNGKLWLGTNGMSTFYRSLNDFGYSIPVTTTKKEKSTTGGIVYPNPASNNLTLELINATEGNAVITIFDALGQSVYQAQTNVKAGKVSIDISSFAKGMYHLQVLGIEDKNLVTTFIKQ
ncbi:MAG: T9SS type A sorting domain-containing protein [Bacteroidia bacterium]|nr:T9SS type A sorting domain-containing protein [Bacteroidia bacterium]MCZ2248474.1 T9SS type A sorting domain-containing protein [Bacteroidia bacterium]